MFAEAISSLNSLLFCLVSEDDGWIASVFVSLIQH